MVAKYSTRYPRGFRFHSLTIISRSDRNRHYWCECDCGNKCEVRADHISDGSTASCGCLRPEKIRQLKTTHGHHPTGKPSHTYEVWCRMKARCINSQRPDYKHYGGRGIKVCDRWLNSFPAFLEDMGERPDGSSIDRINNNGNYEPGNCRWATQLEQAANKRSTMKLRFQGKELMVREWSELIGVKYNTLLYRISHGWAIDKILRPGHAQRS